jgi:prefoldin alpha subunit
MNKIQQQELQTLGMQIQQVQQYLEALEMQTQEVANALSSMEELEKLPKGTTAYVPLTNGIFVKAKLETTKEYLINIGNNITTVKNPEETKKILQEQQEELGRVQQHMVEQFSQMYQQYLALQMQQGA